MKENTINPINFLPPLSKWLAHLRHQEELDRSRVIITPPIINDFTKLIRTTFYGPNGSMNKLNFSQTNQPETKANFLLLTQDYYDPRFGSDVTLTVTNDHLLARLDIPQ